tara:strand:+ start:2194 stop:2352 length:159 start_codon:yes stop_codon:yes gene_type:complete
MGKGSKRRPCQISQEEYKENWEKIFKKEKIDKPVTIEIKEIEKKETQNVKQR